MRPWSSAASQGLGRGDDPPGFNGRVHDVDPAAADDPLQPQGDLGTAPRNHIAPGTVFGGLEEQCVLALRTEVFQEVLDAGLGVFRQELLPAVVEPAVHRLRHAGECASVRLPSLSVCEEPVAVLEVVQQDPPLRVLDRVLHEPYDLPLAGIRRCRPHPFQEPDDLSAAPPLAAPPAVHVGEDRPHGFLHAPVDRLLGHDLTQVPLQGHVASRCHAAHCVRER